ncbi:MAG TPA: hypothetical protein VFJ74_08365 [Gemmatimonadaceae bacterium]|nr:hypothetical protein [Gemmatimonadaceae bacterium]
MMIVSGGAPTVATTMRLARIAPLATLQLAAAAQLVPIVPILLLPFIIVAFVVFAPLWGAALLVLGVLRLIFWPIERLLAALHVPGAGEGSAALARANRWVSTLGGLTERYARSHAGPPTAAGESGARDDRVV